MSAKCRCVCLLPSYWLSNSVGPQTGRQTARPTGDPDTLSACSFPHSQIPVTKLCGGGEGGVESENNSVKLWRKWARGRFASPKTSGPSGLRLVPQQCKGRDSSNSAAGGKSSHAQNTVQLFAPI